MEKVIDCYALWYQGMLATQMGQATDSLKKTQKEIEGAKFTIKELSGEGRDGHPQSHAPEGRRLGYR